jgi:Aerotolerance regulator N-terminal
LGLFLYICEVSFAYPLFLVAGLALAIPILIHLFNLRRYKVVAFPHTRFLRNIQLSSRRQSQVRYKWLLAARLLFLAGLVLAFAQPFFDHGHNGQGGNRLQIIYLDNSYSMSARHGSASMLDMAREWARKRVAHAAPGTRFLLLTNDRPASYRPQAADKVYAAITGTEVSAASRSVDQVLALAQSMLPPGTDADLYYYSDFQQSAFPAPPGKDLMKHIAFYGMPVQTDEGQDIYIDTAYLTTPVLETGKTNYIVARVKLQGSAPKESPVLNLSINGQVKSAATLAFNDRNESMDTLGFQVNNASWQDMTLTVNDGGMRFDDTFRVTARSSPDLSVLVLTEGQPNAYIQAAFRAYNGFRLNQVDVATAPAEWKDYNLVILNGVTHIDAALGKAMNAALQAGQTICIFPGRTTNLQALNDGLKEAGDIRLAAVDTAAQTAGSLQQGSPLVRDLFEQIPDNVQLPVANWHYVVAAGLSANQQSVLSFRNGDPFLACYTPSAGKLYLCATGADLPSGNFPGSYFFTPFLYEMAIQSGSSSVYAITAGGQQPVYLPLAHAAGRNTIHVYAPGMDVIPPQRPSGAGVDVFVGQVVQRPGFYALGAEGGDTTQVALNQSKDESLLQFRDIAALKQQWKGDNIHWPDPTGGSGAAGGEGGSFPLWKVCVLLAVVMLGVETFLLARKNKLAAAQA